MMKVEPMNPKALIEDKKNPNKMDPKKYMALCESIRLHGILNPIIIDKDNNIIDGHHRQKAALDLGLKEVPVLKVPLSKHTDKKILQQILNKVKGTHDEKMDAEIFKEIMQNETMQDIARQLGETEQSILKTLDSLKLPNDIMQETEANSVKSLGKLQITCPGCKLRFTKGES